MSRDKWKRDPLTGISVKKLRSTDYANHYGEFKAHEFSGCNLFDVRSIAHAAGLSRPDNFKRALTDTSSHFHLHALKDDDGKVLSYATHVDSAFAGGESYRQAAKARMFAGKKPTDVSSGSA